MSGAKTPTTTPSPRVRGLSEAGLRWLLIPIAALGLAAGPLCARQIAITIDDLPYVMPSRVTPEQGLADVKQVVAALAAHDAPATGFVVGGTITARTRPALRAFVAAGHGVGNHSWSHGNFNRQDAETFREEVRRTHAALSEVTRDLRFFRFPYLKTGRSARHRQAARAVLAEFGYRNAPVTIDNDEWRFNADYMDALQAGDTTRAARIGAAYLAHMREGTRHFQALSHAAFGRDVRHILLLHMNRINAVYLDDLLGWYAAQGWTFITLADAMEDALHDLPDLYVGDRGLSQIERVLAPSDE